IKVEPSTAPGEYNFAVTGYTVTEGGPLVNVAVTRTAPFTAAGSVAWTTSNGTAIAGSDFGTNGNPAQKTGTLTWTAGTGGTKNIPIGPATANIPVPNDGVAESDETFDITLSSPVGGVLGASTSTTITIKDGAVFAFDQPTSTVGETGGNINVQVNRTGDTSV